MTKPRIQYIGSALADSLSDDQIALVCHAINRYGNTGPYADNTSLQYFAIDFARTCLNRAELGGHFTQTGLRIADQVRAILQEV